MQAIDLVDFRFSLGNWRSDPVVLEGVILPRKFAVDLMLKDLKPESSLLWSIKLEIEFNSEEIPRAMSITTNGFSHSKNMNSIKRKKNPEPVELWQLEYVEKNLAELVALAVSCAAQAVTWESPETITDEVVYSQQSEESSIQGQVDEGIINWSDPSLNSKWALNNKFTQYDYDSGVDWVIDHKTLEAIQNNIVKRTRKRVWTDSFIKQVAEIHINETERAKDEGRRARQVSAIKSHFATNERTADSWIVEARKRGFLKPAPARSAKKNIGK